MCVREKLHVREMCVCVCERLCVTKLCNKELCVTKLCVKELCVTKLCVTKLCEREVACERDVCVCVKDCV